MGYEIELKAHVKQNKVKYIISKLKCLLGLSDLGRIEKEDIYWAVSENDKALFRTRLEKTSEGTNVRITSKPVQTSEGGTEFNQENEFICPADQWESVLEFCRSLNLKICRKKWKKGYNFILKYNRSIIHIELLNVHGLGWFLEMEICGDDEADINKELYENNLHDILKYVGLDLSCIENKSYKELLTEAGCLFG